MSEYLLTGIGKRIKEIRLLKEMKLTETAELAGISKGLLSKIENGRTVPSLPVLLSVVKVLQVSLPEFFQNLHFEQEGRYIHKKAHEFTPFQKEDNAHGFQYFHILEKNLERFTVEAALLDIEPGSQRQRVSTDAYEFKFMLRGTVHYDIEGEELLLEAGDALFYNGSLPHVPINRSEETARMLVLYLYYNSENT